MAGHHECKWLGCLGLFAPDLVHARSLIVGLQVAPCVCVLRHPFVPSISQAPSASRFSSMMRQKNCTPSRRSILKLCRSSRKVIVDGIRLPSTAPRSCRCFGCTNLEELLASTKSTAESEEQHNSRQQCASWPRRWRPSEAAQHAVKPCTARAGC